MTVSDNGKGISKDIELEDLDTLGLQLVSILIDQLDGNIELKRDQGTEFRITFDIVQDCLR
ncbi:ATP-binding protein [Methanosarcina horonobensis]|nr:ATP-binding protein [Methanosarcina horonobensis]